MARKTKLTPVEQARVDVEAALAAFTTAAQNLESAAETFEKEVESNTRLIESVQAENVALLREVDQARTVSSRLTALTAP